MDLLATFCVVIFSLQGLHTTQGSGHCPSTDVEGDRSNTPPQNCQDIYYSDRHYCYDTSVETDCCNKCEAFESTEPECLYGDRTPYRCFSISPHECYDESVERDCCHTCASMTRNIEGCPYGDEDEDLCYVLETDRCYEEDIRQICCEVCHDIKVNVSDCPYGNKNLTMCNQVHRAMCYNKDIENTCCHTCDELKDPNSPGCEYGDKFDWCLDLYRNDCYNTTVRRDCCRSCSDFGNPDFEGCEFGDRSPDDCYDIVGSDCTSNAELRRSCCERCSYLQENDCPDGEADHCFFSIMPSQCYLEDERRECCHTCLLYYDSSQQEDCRYGDREPLLCFDVSANDCYNDTINRRCCDTCSYWETDQENCLFGDRIECISIKAHDCYKVERDCCDTCTSFFDVSERYGHDCRYGNKWENCSDTRRHQCYQGDVRQNCCETCIDMEDEHAVGCEFGSRSANCSVQRRECYTREHECCEVCPPMKQDLAGCQYGDRRDDCANIWRGQCYDDNTRHECCETCHRYEDTSRPAACRYGDWVETCNNIDRWECYDRNIRLSCCEKCAQMEDQNNPGCEFGSRDGQQCNSIERYECYVRAFECCDQCPSMAGPIENCLYGDRQNCSDIVSQDCYSPDTPFQCCESCHNNKDTSAPANCQYGDRDESFCNIDASDCYNPNTKYICCRTCDNFVVSDVLGCEYGDRSDSCNVNQCLSYSGQQLANCCHTCKDYYTSPTTTTSSTTSSTSTTAVSTSTSTTSATQRTTAPTTPSTTESDVGETDEQSQRWIAPTAGGVAAGVVLIALVIVLFLWWSRRKTANSKSMGNTLPSHYALERPAAPGSVAYSNNRNNPRKESFKKLEDEESEYAYINPDDVKSILSDDGNRAQSSQGAYMEPSSARPYAILEPMANGVTVVTPVFNRPVHSSPAHYGDQSTAHNGAQNIQNINNPAYSSNNSTRPAELVIGVQKPESGYATLTPESGKPEHQYGFVQ